MFLRLYCSHYHQLSTQLIGNPMTVKVSVSELPSYYDFYRKDKVPLMVVGHSGIGKTEISAQWSTDVVGNCLGIRTSQLDPSDVKGVPYREGIMSRWATPDFLPQAERDGEEGVLLMDEYLDGDEAVFAACQSLILERHLGSYTLPNGWQIIALGNRKEHGGINRGLSNAQQSRFAHLEAVMDPDGLKRHFIQRGVDPIVISFLHMHPDMILKIPERGSDEWAYCTPRAWERVSRIREQNPDKSMRFNLYSSLVGEGAATAFDAHERIAVEVPDPADCIKSPLKTKVPENPSAKYAIACSLAKYSKPETFDNIVQYMGRLEAEFSTLTVMEAIKMSPELTETKAFTDWSMQNSDVLLG